MEEDHEHITAEVISDSARVQGNIVTEYLETAASREVSHNTEFPETANNVIAQQHSCTGSSNSDGIQSLQATSLLSCSSAPTVEVPPTTTTVTTLQQDLPSILCTFLFGAGDDENNANYGRMEMSEYEQHGVGVECDIRNITSVDETGTTIDISSANSSVIDSSGSANNSDNANIVLQSAAVATSSTDTNSPFGTHEQITDECFSAKITADGDNDDQQMTNDDNDEDDNVLVPSGKQKTSV